MVDCALFAGLRAQLAGSESIMTCDTVIMGSTFHYMARLTGSAGMGACSAGGDSLVKTK